MQSWKEAEWIGTLSIWFLNALLKGSFAVPQKCISPATNSAAVHQLMHVNL